MHTCMVKVISISDEAYKELKERKAARSFSEIIIELTVKRKRPLSDFAGILTDEEAESIKKEMYEMRKMPSRRFR